MAPLLGWALAGYGKQMGFFGRHLFGDSRRWVCSRASGDTLEVAVGTGLNLPFYGDRVRLTGIDFTPAMLAVARDRAAQLSRVPVLREADALALPFPDASFDTVVCTFSLCAIVRAKTSSMSCDQAVFVDQATGAGLPSDAVPGEIDRFG